jgi:predicted ATPase/class 3 adenylate cyclase
MVELPSGTVTFLFTDLEGSTRLWEDHPEAMKDASARHDEILRDAVTSHAGHVVKLTGDGVHAAFADATCAVEAAVEAQRALTAEVWDTTAPLHVRMGIHTGPAEERAGDYYGTAVNRAARLMSVAHGGQVVVSLTTEELLRDAGRAVELIDLGEHRLRDLSSPERIFQFVGAGLQREFPALHSIDAYRGNLPVQLTSFVGRDEELPAIAEALHEARLVTLTGAGGVGKTRLALQVAADVLDRFADGVWLCELAATNGAELFGQVIVAALDVPPRAGRSLVESVCDYLSGRQALIVLDNCEHVLDAAAAMAEAMLRAAAAVRVLATSRELLGVAGERVVGVRSLHVTSGANVEAIAACEAVRLFVERAKANRADFGLDAANADDVVEICRRLDGIPLALELAAARVTSMGPGEIAGLLDERFRLLTGGQRRDVERHQTLHATVQWSYALLDHRDRVVFDRLGVFSGSFDANGATAVAADEEVTPWDVRDALGDLAAKSMVVREDGPDGARFRLHETLRQYALERLDETSRAEDYRRRHAGYYVRFAEAAGPALEGPDEVAWARRFEAELDNLRAAVAWALDADATFDSELGVRIIGAFAHQPLFRPSAGVGEWAEAALARFKSSPHGCPGALFVAAAFKELLAGDLDTTRTRAFQALRDEFASDASSTAWAHAALSVANARAGRYEEALEAVAAGRRALDVMGAEDNADLVLIDFGAHACWFAGRDEEARALAQDALRRARALGNPSHLIMALRFYAQTRRSDESDETMRALHECLDHSSTVTTPDSPNVLRAQGILATLLARRGDRTAAIETLREAVTRAHDTGQLLYVAIAVNYGVSVTADINAPELAATLGGALAEGPLSWIPSASPAETLERRTALDRVRAQLGPERYRSLLASASPMSYQQIIDHTVAELDRLLRKPSSAE